MIAIISVFVGIAIPLTVNLLRDQRVNRAALEVAEMYRQARTRSLSHGTAVLVRWTSGVGAKSQGRLEMLEATYDMDPTNTMIIPNTASCLGTTWVVGAVDNKSITSFEPGLGPYDYLGLGLLFNGQGAASLDVCFTPHGRTWARVAPTGTFAQLTTTPVMTVTNTNTTRQRQVLLPPSGAARVEL